MCQSKVRIQGVFFPYRVMTFGGLSVNLNFMNEEICRKFLFLVAALFPFEEIKWHDIYYVKLFKTFELSWAFEAFVFFVYFQNRLKLCSKQNKKMEQSRISGTDPHILPSYTTTRTKILKNLNSLYHEVSVNNSLYPEKQQNFKNIIKSLVRFFQNFQLMLVHLFATFVLW